MTLYEKKIFVKQTLDKIDDKISLSDRDFVILVNGDFEYDSEVLKDTNDGFVVRKVIVRLGERYFCVEYEEFTSNQKSKIISFNQPTEVECIKVPKVVTEYVPLKEEHQKFCFGWGINGQKSYFSSLEDLIEEEGDKLRYRYVRAYRRKILAQPKFSLSAQSVIQLVEKDLDPNYEEGDDSYYYGELSENDFSVLQDHLDSLAIKYSARQWGSGGYLNAQIQICEDDIKYYKETKELSPRLKDWLSTIFLN